VQSIIIIIIILNLIHILEWNVCFFTVWFYF